jgi:hypothetical protein
VVRQGQGVVCLEVYAQLEGWYGIYVYDDLRRLDCGRREVRNTNAGLEGQLKPRRKRVIKGWKSHLLDNGEMDL